MSDLLAWTEKEEGKEKIEFAEEDFMKKQHFSIKVKAPKEKVWQTLFDDKTFRDWGSIIDEGQYMVGELAEGSEVQFISSVSSFGVTSVIEKLIPHEYVAFKHVASRCTRKDVG